VTTTDQALALASANFMEVARRASTLYELDDQAEALLSLLDSAETPEEQATLLAELDLNELLTQGKVEGYLAVIDELKRLAEGRKAAAKRLRDRAEIPEKAIDRLKANLLEHMQRTGQQRIETQLFTVRRQMNPPSAEVYDKDAIPGRFIEIRTEEHVHIREIIAEFKATGEVIPGVTVSQREGIRLQ
jgi:hypothetical protein